MGYIETMVLFLPKRIFFATMAFLALFLLGAEDHRPPLTVAAVQMHIDSGMYLSQDAFWTAIETPLARAAENGADLVVFPEYLGVFYSLIPYAPLFQGASSMAEALARLSRQRGTPASPIELFLSQGSMVEQAMQKWAGLSREYGITIVAGSYFVPHDQGGETLELRNRAFVVAPDRGVVYYQDKVFLTDFEREICGLSPGRVEKGGFDLQGRRVVMTLCRDTFFPVWEQVFTGGVDLWIDIKANGVAFDREQQEIFQRALPARLPGTPIPYGLTVCLTGRYLDLYWEGRSSLIKNSGGRVCTVIEAKTFDEEELIVYQLP